MRVTNFSDYAFRVLMHAAMRDDRLITIKETAELFGISRAHLMKVVNVLTRAGYLTAVRGRAGGLALARPPREIGLGEVVRATEPDFAPVPCFTTADRDGVAPCCQLRDMLGEAVAAFVGTLDRYSLDDLMLRPEDFGLPRRKF